MSIGHHKVKAENPAKVEYASVLVTMSLTSVLSLTGLYYGSHRRGICKSIVVARAVLFCGAATFFEVYFFHHIFSNVPNLDTLSSCGVILQATLSMYFFLCWQHQGHLRFLISYIRASQHCAEVRNFIRISVFVLFIVFMLFFAVALYYFCKPLLFVSDSNATTTHTEIFLSVLSYSVQLHAMYAWNAILVLFVVSIKTLAIDLEHFNRDMEKTLSGAISIKEERLKIETTLLNCFEGHCKLADRIRKIDSIFRLFIFLLLLTGVITTIFSLIALIRKKSWLNFVFAIPKVICCFLHIYGLCVIPAQIYTKFRAVHDLLYRNYQIWMEFDPRIYQITNMFTGNISNSNISITLWGFTPIRNTLILTVNIFYVQV
ncbi:GUstatory Receptor family [Ditylenchus destructor]|uniref:GUstatory Receptor family n=1 Tax=Ditylenchus destructor TaxID=166010 RepID=A0AAD4QZX7_9BILA|nr:GUstatory Receptor family [Ditylenchus destructor]